MASVDRPRKTALILAQRIVRDMHERDVQPGDMLQPERLMMEEYKAGRGTLRESLRYLELQGLLVFKPGPGGGPIVRKPGAESLAATLALLLQFDRAPYRVIAEARAAIEPLMARLAAERIDPERRAILQRSLVDMEHGIEDVETYLSTNEVFHNTIAWASGNSLFGFLVDVMVGEMDISGAVHGVQYPIQRRRAVLKAHQRIFDAIDGGDQDGAEEAMRTHIDEYLTYALKKYPEVMDKQITWR